MRLLSRSTSCCFLRLGRRGGSLSGRLSWSSSDKSRISTWYRPPSELRAKSRLIGEDVSRYESVATCSCLLVSCIWDSIPVKPVEAPLRDSLRSLAASREAISPSIDLGKKICRGNQSDMIKWLLRKDTHNERDGGGNNTSEPRNHYQKI